MQSETVDVAGSSQVVLEEILSFKDVNHFDDVTPVVLFVQSGGLKRTLQLLQLAMRKDETTKFMLAIKGLTHVLSVINFALHDESSLPLNEESRLRLREDREPITQFYLDFGHDLWMVYKTFGMRKPKLVEPVVGVLTALVEYKNPRVLMAFIEAFDVSNPVVHKLLVPTRDDFDRTIVNVESMRAVFMEFLINLYSKCDFTIRMNFMTNTKLMGCFWKYLEMDRYDVLANVFEFLLNLVLGEPRYKKSNKTRILNENFMYNIRPLYEYIKPQNDRVLDNEDVDEFNRFKTAFNDFMETLTTDRVKGISFPENEFGMPLVVNKISFKINNRLLYVLLTALKPWESHLQLQRVVKILNSTPELLPPYMHWIVSSSGGYHDPALTSYWIGHTLLYTQILQSTSLPAKTEYIALFPLSGPTMVSVLAFPVALVQQMGLQLILLQLRRLSTPGIPQAVIELVLSTFPPQSAFLPFLLHENRFLKITATQIIATWEQIAPRLSSSAVLAAVAKKLSAFNSGVASISGRELVLLDNYLSIQSNNDLKWWNKTGSENSFFTSLLKLSNLPALRVRMLKILQKLTKSSLAFNLDGVIEDPLLVLVEVMSAPLSAESARKLYNCLDETIGRIIKTPYKYLDKSTAHYSRLSIFVVVLFEQLKFIPAYETEIEIHRWLNLLAKGLVVIGEPQNGMEALAKDNSVQLTINLRGLSLKARPASKIDFAETAIIFNRFADSDTADGILFDAAAKLGQYLASADAKDALLFDYITNTVNWRFMSRLEGTLTNNQYVACCLLADVLKLWMAEWPPTNMAAFVYETSQKPLAPTSQSALVRFLFFLSDDQIVSLSKCYANKALVTSVYKEVLQRGLHVAPDYRSLMEIGTADVDAIIRAFPPPSDQLETILEYSQFAHLFENASDDAVLFLLSKSTLPDVVLYHAAVSSREIAEKYRDRVVRLTQSLQKWPLSLRIFTAHLDFFDWESTVALVLQHTNKKPKDAMTADFVRFFAAGLDNGVKDVLPQCLRWLNRAMLYITKKFAERPALSAQFDYFLAALGDLFTCHNAALGAVATATIDTQLQVVLSHNTWVARPQYLSYVNKLVLAAKHAQIHADKLLQMFVNNDKMALHSFPLPELAQIRFESALLIHSLYNVDVARSDMLWLLEKVLCLYFGSPRAEDLLLKSVLISLEKKLAKSWVSLVTGWAFLKELTREELELVGSERLFIREKSSLVVALQKNFVRNTIENVFGPPALPAAKTYAEYVEFAAKCSSPPYFQSVYDPEFLLLVIANNVDFIEYVDGQSTIDVSLLTNSELLRFVVAALANPQLRPICKVILHGILKFVQGPDTKFKDKNVFTVYVASVLHTLRVADHLVPLVWYIYGTFGTILGDPSHHMYDLVFHYVLANPVIKGHDIPMFAQIAGSFRNDDVGGDAYYREVDWMVQHLAKGVTTAEDVRLLKCKHVVEWGFSLINCKFVSSKLRNKILRLVYALQTAGASGSEMLITQSGALAALQMAKNSIGKDALPDQQLRLSIDQIALRFAYLGSQKRLVEWTYGDVTRAAKRIHLV